MSKEKIISIGQHKESMHETFSDALTCLSHALEAVDMALDDGCTQKDTLMCKIHDAFEFGEMLETVEFGGDFEVIKHEKQTA